MLGYSRQLQAIAAVSASAVLASMASAGCASAQQVFAFEGVPHGQDLSAPIGPLSIQSLTPGARLEAFDTTRRGTDVRWLEGPDDTPLPDRTWSLGNVSPLQNAGVVLRAAESPTGSAEMVIDFGGEFAAATFDMLNIADPGAVEITAIDAAGQAAELTLEAMRDPRAPAFVPGVAFGQGSNNRIGPIDAAALGLSGVQRLRLRLPLNAAIDRLVLHETMPDDDDIDLALLAEGAMGSGTGGFGGAAQGGGVAIGLFVGGGGGGGGGGGSASSETAGSSEITGSLRLTSLPPGNDPDRDPPPSLPPNDGPPPADQIPVPTPTAFAAGLALLALLGTRRSRRDRAGADA
ncbi:MAG: hypothetical protein AAGB29_03785 [Planctomycetota bacterium]